MELNEKEQKKYEIIEKVVNNEISKKEARDQLSLSGKQVNRLIAVFKEQGKEGFIHKNRGKIKQNKKASNIISEIKELYLKEYYDYNLEAFYEVIENQYNISYSTMYNEFLNDDIISPIAHKKNIKII